MTELASAASALAPYGGVGLVLVAGIRAYRDIRIAKINQAVELKRIEHSGDRPTSEAA